MRDGGAMARAGGMALGGGGHVFGAVVDDLDRVAGLHREQRGVRADDGGEVFLAAEGSAGFGLDDAALFFGQVEDQRRARGRGSRGTAWSRARMTDSTVPSGVAEALGDDAVVLDVELLLRAGACTRLRR